MRLKLDNLFILRAFLMLYICINHSNTFLEGLWIKFYVTRDGNEHIPPTGIFFTLSGFFMIYILDFENKMTKKQELKKFIVDRFSKIYPCYLLSILAIILMRQCWMLFLNPEHFPYRLLYQLFMIPSHYQTIPIVIHTLYLEIFFYYVVTLGIIIRYKKEYVILGILIVLFSIPYLFPNSIPLAPQRKTDINYHDFISPILRLITDNRIIYIIFGVITALLFKNLKRLPTWCYKIILLLTILFVILFCYFFGNDQKFFLSYFVVWGIFIIFLTLDILGINFKYSKKLVYLGRISYSFYLFNGLMIYLVPKLLKNTPFYSYFPGWLIIILIIIGSIFSASIIYEYYENPIRLWIRKKINQNSQL